MQRNKCLSIHSDPISDAILEDVLGAAGKLRFCRDYDSLLQEAIEWSPDLIFVTARDSEDFLRAVRKHERIAEVPILCITAKGDREARMAALDAGVDDFITKPFDLEEFEVRVRSILRLNRFQRLNNERAMFEWIAEHVPSGILTLDAEGRINFANRVARQWLELPAEFDPLNFFSWSRQHFDCRPRQLWKEAQDGDSEQQRCLTMIRRPCSEALEQSDQSLRIYEAHLLPLASASGFQQVIFMQETTARTEQDHLLWSLQNAISHKMRTPLNGLLGALSLMSTSEDLEELEPEETLELTQTAFQSASRLNEVFEGISRFTEMPVGNGLEEEICDLECLGAVLKETAEQAQVAHLILSSKEESLPPGTLQISRPRLEMILRELFHNARKFHPKLQPTVDVSWTVKAGQIALTFVDNGRWIKGSQLGFILQPFYQAEERHTGEVAGGGMGLATVARVVWALHGDVEVANREGSPGCQVKLTLPFEPADAPAGASQALLRPAAER